MNLDLLIKLVKLANNNPNENEANLAARKVCKMIEANNYKFNNNATEQSDPFDVFNDFIKRSYRGVDWSSPFYKKNKKYTYPPNEYPSNTYEPKKHPFESREDHPDNYNEARDGPKSFQVCTICNKLNWGYKSYRGLYSMGEFVCNSCRRRR